MAKTPKTKPRRIRIGSTKSPPTLSQSGAIDTQTKPTGVESSQVERDHQEESLANARLDMAFNALADVRELRQDVFEWAKPDWLKAAESFFAKYMGHPALEQDSIYALPSTLIDPICKYVDLFTPEEEDFERHLSDISGLGYFLKRPVSCSLPFGRESPRVDEMWRNNQIRQIESNKAIIELLTEVMLKQGVSSDEIEAYFKEERDWELKFEDIRMGFSGWLATEPAFRQEVAKLRAKWEDRIRINERLPMISISINGEQGWPVPMPDRDLHAEFMDFYWRWGLETLATWDLPVPVLPGLTQPSLYGQIDQENMGLVSFIPWYFLREKGIDIQQFAKHRGLGSISPLLKNWLNAEPKYWGCGRYGQMLRLFLFFELAIKSRYGERLRGKLANFEEAFLCYLNGEKNTVSLDNLRKIRQEMNRRINLCSKPSAVANCCGHELCVANSLPPAVAAGPPSPAMPVVRTRTIATPGEKQHDRAD